VIDDDESPREVYVDEANVVANDASTDNIGVDYISNLGR